MAENQNYTELKEWAKHFLQVVTSDDLYYGVFLLIALLISLKAIDLVFRPFRKKNVIYSGFLKGVIQAFLIITIGMKIITLSPALSGFTSQILMSSSLIVVVLGFVFQEGLSNIVHGFILFVFKPFRIGDRITITVDGVQITGYVLNIDLRSTEIQNVLNASHVIVPNAKVDTAVIDNNYYHSKYSSNFLDFSVTYDSDIDRVILATREVIRADERVAAAVRDAGAPADPDILVRGLDDSGVSIRAVVITKTIEENFGACSEIRRMLIRRFREEGIEFAYPHMTVVPKAQAGRTDGE